MLTREDKVERSIVRFLRAELELRGYTEPKVKLQDAFPSLKRGEAIDSNHATVAAGFDQDQEAVEAELGSTLVTRPYTFEFVTFAGTRTLAKNVGNQIKFILDTDTVPLLDWDDEALPEIDRLIGLGTTAERVAIPDPEPWQENVWLTVAQFEDTYDARLA